MIWLLMIFQVIFVKIGWWVYRVYFTQPKHNHPSIFWNPVMRALFAYGPSIGIVGLIVAAFLLNTYPWPFLALTLAFWGYSGHKARTAAKKHFMPVLTGDGVKIEALSAEELLKDIRRHNRETGGNRQSSALED